MPNRPLILLLASASALLGPACSSNKTEEIQVAAPLLEISDAYELAGLEALPEVSPKDMDGLRNLYKLSNTILSGSEPIGEAAFAELERLGVRTVLSVDGKAPDQELAARHGMRYVHVPIRYHGIEEEELLQIAKTFRELEAPFYVHCFHGKHRGPAAAAVGRAVLDGAERERVVAEMRQWCGTSKKYTGLYETLASKPLPSAEETAAYAWDFPAAKPIEGFRQAMVEMTRLSDNVELIADNDWKADPAHPDVDPLNEAQQLLEIFRAAIELDEVIEQPEDFREWMARSVAASEKLVDAIQSDARAEALAAFDDVQSSCTDCHAVYRNGK